MTAQAKLNDLVREAYDAQEGFDNWDGGKTFYPCPFNSGPHHCTLDTVVAELDAANLKLVRYVLAHGKALESELNSTRGRGAAEQAAPVSK